MLNKQFSINRIGEGNFEKPELTKSRNMLTKRRLSLFVRAMLAVLFVCFAVGCTTDFPAGQPQKTPENVAKLTNFLAIMLKNTYCSMVR